MMIEKGINSVQEPTCRHEYVRIYQRKLKGLERRLCVQRAYLPVGFKMTDLAHLGEGSFCFCSKCRARLYPRRTQAEKLAARQALAAAKGAEALAALQAEENAAADSLEIAQDAKITDIHVEELEQEPIDVQDIEADGVKLSDDDGDSCLNDEDL